MDALSDPRVDRDLLQARSLLWVGLQHPEHQLPCCRGDVAGKRGQATSQRVSNHCLVIVRLPRILCSAKLQSGLHAPGRKVASRAGIDFSHTVGARQIWQSFSTHLEWESPGQGNVQCHAKAPDVNGHRVGRPVDAKLLNALRRDRVDRPTPALTQASDTWGFANTCSWRGHSDEAWCAAMFSACADTLALCTGVRNSMVAAGGNAPQGNLRVQGSSQPKVNNLHKNNRR